ncbi:MAG: hypothetical protein AAGU27_02445 [Dehalobacterium sp.]
MKKFSRFVALLMVFLLAFVLPMAVFAVKEGNDANVQTAPNIISTLKINVDTSNEASKIYDANAIEVSTLKEIDNGNRQGLKTVWVLQDNKSLIQEKNVLADGLEQAKAKLRQLNTEYKKALIFGDPAEINYLSAYIATEKSNITIIKDQLEKIIEEMHTAKELAKI